MRRVSRREVVGWLGAILLALAAPAVFGANVRVDVQREGRELVIEARAAVDAPPAIAWRVLTSYERYALFVPGVRSSRVVRRNGTAVTVEQSSSAFLGLARMPVRIVYEIREEPPGDVWSSATVEALGALHSHYAIEASDDGATLAYRGHFALRSDALASIEAVAARQTVAKQFAALAAEIERSAALARRAAPQVRS